MSNVIHGSNCKVEMLVTDQYYEILCQSEMKFRLNQEVILKTGQNSGLYKEKATRLTEAFCSVSGLTPVNNGTVISFFYVLQESIRKVAQPIKLTFTDEAGVSKYITGSALIVNAEIDGSYNDFAGASLELEFTGAIDITSVNSEPPGQLAIYADFWTTTPTQTFLNAGALGSVSVELGLQLLTGAELLVVDRDGTQYDVLLSGTPGNRQVVFDNVNGILTFQNPFADGETVGVAWIYPV